MEQASEQWKNIKYKHQMGILELKNKITKIQSLTDSRWACLMVNKTVLMMTSENENPKGTCNNMHDSYNVNKKDKYGYIYCII